MCVGLCVFVCVCVMPPGHLTAAFGGRLSPDQRLQGGNHTKSSSSPAQTCLSFPSQPSSHNPQFSSRPAGSAAVMRRFWARPAVLLSGAGPGDGGMRMRGFVADLTGTLMTVCDTDADAMPRRRRKGKELRCSLQVSLLLTAGVSVRLRQDVRVDGLIDPEFSPLSYTKNTEKKQKPMKSS